MLTLYELTGALADIRDLLDDDLLGVERSKAEELVDEILENLIPAKVEGYCGLIRSLKLEAEAFKEEGRRLEERRKARENLSKRLQVRLQDALTHAEIQKLKAGRFTVAIQASAPSVKVHDKTTVPQDFFIPQEPKLDRRALLSALKLGREIPGAEVIRGEHLRIR